MRSKSKELLYSIVPLVNIKQCTSEFIKRLGFMLNVFYHKTTAVTIRDTKETEKCWIYLIILIVVMVS